VAAWFPDMSTIAKAREKISTYFLILRFFDACLTKFKNYQNLPHEISHISTDQQAIYGMKDPYWFS
jgi:hypothetical protein